jgi:hypothetical protein
MPPINFAEKYFEIAEDLRVALRKGWLTGDGDRDACCCAYCGEPATHDAKARGYVCKHAPTCLMVKHAQSIGDVNDPSEN